MKALIFDFDGTIIDTEYPELAAWQAIYTEFNVELPLHEWYQHIGAAEDYFSPLNYLESKCSKITKKDILKKYAEKIAEFASDLKPLPGVREWIEAAHEVGMAMAVASNASFQFIQQHLQRVDLLDYFKMIISREDVVQPKPHPEIYHLAVTKLNIEPKDAVAIEDSPIGATAAVAAGLQCIVVPNKMTAALQFPSVTFMLENLKELTLQEAIKKIWQK